MPSPSLALVHPSVLVDGEPSIRKILAYRFERRVSRVHGWYEGKKEDLKSRIILRTIQDVPLPSPTNVGHEERNTMQNVDEPINSASQPVELHPFPSSGFRSEKSNAHIDYAGRILQLRQTPSTDTVVIDYNDPTNSSRTSSVARTTVNGATEFPTNSAEPRRPFSRAEFAPPDDGIMDGNFVERGIPQDLKREVSAHRGGFHVEGLDRISRLYKTGRAALLRRFEKTGKGEDLDELITFLHQSLDPSHSHFGDAEHTASLTCLAAALQTRFEKNGLVQDMEEVTRLRQEVLELGHRVSSPPESCSGTDGDALDQANGSNQSEEILRGRNSSRKHRGSPNVAYSLPTVMITTSSEDGYDQSEELPELHRVSSATFPPSLTPEIRSLREVLKFCPPGDANHIMCLNELAATLIRLFNRTDLLKDLDEAIGFLRQAVERSHPGNAEHISSLKSLASAMHVRYEHTGLSQDVEQVIRLHAEVSALGHAGGYVPELPPAYDGEVSRMTMQASSVSPGQVPPRNSRAKRR